MTPSSLHDPHNQVPEVTPDDEWGDPHAADAATHASLGLLPPRKSRGGDLERPAESGDGGLRIDLTPIDNSRPDDDSRGLEVEEIDGTVTRLTADLPAPTVTERRAIFIHRPEEDPHERKHRGEARDWGQRPGGSVRWLIGTGAGLAALFVLILIALPSINGKSAKRPTELPVTEGTPEPPGVDEVKLREMMVARPEVERLVAAFVSAPVADDLIRLIRDSDKVGPLVRANRLAPKVFPSWHPGEKASWVVHSKEGLYFGEFKGEFPDFTPFRIFVLREDDQWVVDWKASTAYSTATFEELAVGQGDGSEVRGILSPSSFYTLDFPEEHFGSYRFDSPDLESSIWVYSAKGTPAHKDIAGMFDENSILNEDRKTAGVTLMLRRSDGESAANQWEIESLRSPTWVEPNPGPS